jgi:hypothetical protein
VQASRIDLPTRTQIAGMGQDTHPTAQPGPIMRLHTRAKHPGRSPHRRRAHRWRCGALLRNRVLRPGPAHQRGPAPDNAALRNQPPPYGRLAPAPPSAQPCAGCSQHWSGLSNTANSQAGSGIQHGEGYWPRRAPISFRCQRSTDPHVEGGPCPPEIFFRWEAEPAFPTSVG